MRKLDLILENIRDEYMINILEEGTTSELENLKTKKFLNENLSRIRAVLVEEGVMQGVKDHLSDNWGKYLAGAGAAGAGFGVGSELGADPVVQGAVAAQSLGIADTGDVASAMVQGLPDAAARTASNVADYLTDAAGNIYDKAGQLIQKAGEAVPEATPEVPGVVDGAMDQMKAAVGK